MIAWGTPFPTVHIITREVIQEVERPLDTYPLASLWNAFWRVLWARVVKEVEKWR